jgi:hypothetical protein
MEFLGKRLACNYADCHSWEIADMIKSFNAFDIALF